MIIYNPAYDANHCVYRFVSTLEYSRLSSFSWDMFRLVDFYRLYPSQLCKIKPFPKGISKYKHLFCSLKPEYTIQTNSRKTVFKILPIHNLVVHWLIGKGIISKHDFSKGLVSRTTHPIPERMQDEFEKDQTLKMDWMKVLVNDFPLVKIKGKGGIKSRTGFMEYRYDPE